MDSTATRKVPPGPPPISGMFGQIDLFWRMTRNLLPEMERMHAEYGEFYRLEMGSVEQFVVTQPEAYHDILVRHAAQFHKDADYKNAQWGLARFLGNGLLTSDGEFWKRQRKLVAPALHARRIEHYAQTMVDYTERMLAGWTDGARLDISREMAGVTMQIVARSLFNAEIGAEVATVTRAMAAVQEQFSGSKSLPLPGWLPTPREWRANRANHDLDRIIYGIIEDWRRQGGEDRGDLLSMLLLATDDNDQHMTDKQVRDELVTLFLAGHETTANSLNWTWKLLAENPEVEAKLHAELDAVLGDRAPTLADLPNLPYTEMVVKESMRLYPPAWGVGREAVEDVEISGYHVPAGSVVALVFYITHRDPRYWDDPTVFRPERFSEANEDTIPRYAYLPFGGGPRICVGNAFAMMEARLLLATIARRYRLALAPRQQVEIEPLITLVPKGGLPMTVRQRERVPAGMA